MSAPLSKIATPEQFNELLAAALREVAELTRTQPNYPVWRMLLSHLTRMQELSSAPGRLRTADTDRCLPGTIAAKELEPATDVAVYELCQRLHELQYFFQVHLPKFRASRRFWSAES
jgi:hypothetical protein